VQQKVTIVIPVYNGADYLAQAIESALAQTYENTEILVVNDGSTDGGATERIAERYVPRIRFVSKKNGGVASALNLAVKEMSGDYLSWLSHDDLYAPNKLAVQMTALAALPAADRECTILYSDYSVFTTLPEMATPVSIGGVDSAGFRYWLTLENRLHGCTLLIPRQAFEDCGLFDETLRTTQDFDLWFRMARTYHFRHVPEVLVMARSHADQGSIKMAATAQAECNALMSRFVTGLSTQELTAQGKRSPAAAYTELSASFWRRGFEKVAKETFARARQAWRSESPDATMRQTLTVVRAIAARRVLTPIRAAVPPQVRLKLRALINGATGAKTHSEQLEGAPLKERFSAIYDRNIFGGRLSRSGEGSDLTQTEIIRREIPEILKKLGARSFLDAPCGDCFWMQHVDLEVERYIGADIVPAMVAQNQQRFAAPGREFRCLNLTTDELPKVDVIFSRDCLVHLSLEDAMRILSNFKRSGSTFLLTTTFPDNHPNCELAGKHSFWRPLNMQSPPFCFPEPLLILNEGCTEEKGRYASKSLGLWRLEDLDL